MINAIEANEDETINPIMMPSIIDKNILPPDGLKSIVYCMETNLSRTTRWNGWHVVVVRNPCFLNASKNSQNSWCLEHAQELHFRISQLKPQEHSVLDGRQESKILEITSFRMCNSWHINSSPEYSFRKTKELEHTLIFCFGNRYIDGLHLTRRTIVMQSLCVYPVRREP